MLFFMFCKFLGISYCVDHVFLVGLNPHELFPISKGCPAVQGLNNIGFYIQRQCYNALRRVLDRLFAGARRLR